MADVLSQNEIDNLLKAIDSGELDVHQVEQETKERRIKNYDFKRPNKFAKDQLRTLEMIHENYARLISTFLSGYLRAFVNVEVISVEQLTYSEFTNSLSNPTIMGLAEFSPLSGNMILEMNPPVCFGIIDRVLGGKGSAQYKARGFTEIELTIMSNIMSKLIDLSREPWANVIDVSSRLNKIETNSQFAQVMSPNETTVLITMMIKMGDVEGMLNICIPHLTIEPVIDKISTKYWFKDSNRAPANEDIEVLKKRLENAVVPLKVHLGKCEIQLEEFLGLQIGDVIKLDNKCSNSLEMYVHDKLKFRVEPGTVKNKLAVKINDVVRKGEEIYE